jgi:hypothetical protein
MLVLWVFELWGVRFGVICSLKLCDKPFLVSEKRGIKFYWKSWKI